VLKASERERERERNWEAVSPSQPSVVSSHQHSNLQISDTFAYENRIKHFQNSKKIDQKISGIYSTFDKNGRIRAKKRVNSTNSGRTGRYGTELVNPAVPYKIKSSTKLKSVTSFPDTAVTTLVLCLSLADFLLR